MKYWEWVLKFHEKVSKNYPTGENGLKAVLFLKSFFEHIGCESIPRDHPLQNRLGQGSETNYQWLVQYARKLHTSSYIPGFKSIAKRLANTREYFTAYNEIEVALKLYLQNLNVTFAETTSEPTPDLIIRKGQNKVGVEVTSLNPPDEENRVQTFHNQITMSTISKKVVTGGFVSGVPSSVKIPEIMDRLNNTIEKAKQTRKIKKFNEEGVATIYIAPPDMVDQMPEDCRGMYQMRLPDRKPVEEKIRYKIQEKNTQLFPYCDVGVLFIYTGMIDKQNIFELFEHGRNEVDIMLATYPRLLGLVLTVPHLQIHVVSNMKTNNLRKISKGNKVFLESEAGVYQYESSIIWKNEHADQVFPEYILYALDFYSTNLNKLASLQEFEYRVRL